MIDVEQHIKEQLVVERVKRWKALSFREQAQCKREWEKYQRILMLRLFLIGWGYMVCGSITLAFACLLPPLYALIPVSFAPIMHIMLGAMAAPSGDDTPSSEAPPTLEELVIHHHHTAPKAAGGEVTEVS